MRFDYMNIQEHAPVMINEVLEYLSPRDGGVYVDCTFGAGGYSRAVLESCDCKVIAFDQDDTVLPYAQALHSEFGERFEFVQGCFGDIDELLDSIGVSKVSGIVLDIGVSSMQLDKADRGFSFRFDGPLDMRMGRSLSEEMAADLVNEMEEQDLANIIYKYGEERMSRRIAKAIVLKRQEERFETTSQLADVVRTVVKKSSKDTTDPATRTFQALRIAVNDELGELERALGKSSELLMSAGRLVVVTFHSLEDRIVKKYMRAQSGRVSRGSKYLPDASQPEELPLYRDLTRKAVLPSPEEISANSRSRSAKLRAVELVCAKDGGAA